MKIFLFKIIFYFISIIIICFIIQYFVDEGFHKYEADDYAIWNKIFSGEAGSDIIINGSSRAVVEFNPRIIEDSTNLSCFNIGINGGELTTIKSRWDSYIAFNDAPKILIKNFDIILFDEESFIFNKKKYLPYLSNQTVASNLEKIDNNIGLEKNIPFYKYRGLYEMIFIGLKSYFNFIHVTENNSYKGYSPVKKTWNQNLGKHIGSPKAVTLPKNRLKFGFNYFKKLNMECKKKKVKLILVHAPMYYELRRLLPQMDSVIHVMKQLALHNDFQFWDYSKDSISFSRKYYYNSEHLNKLGSEIFSSQLASNLTKYLNTQNLLR